MGKSPGESSSNKIMNLVCFPYVRSDRPDHSHRNDDFPFNQTLQPDPSNPE